MWRGLNKNGKPLLYTLDGNCRLYFILMVVMHLLPSPLMFLLLDKQVSDTQPVIQHISSHNGDIFEPVQSLSANDKGSGGETIVVTDTSSPTTSLLESHQESPLLEIKSPQC